MVPLMPVGFKVLRRVDFLPQPLHLNYFFADCSWCSKFLGKVGHSGKLVGVGVGVQHPRYVQIFARDIF